MVSPSSVDHLKSQDELKPKFKKVFDKYDKDGNGYIDVEEVKEFIKKLGNHLVANVQGFDQMTEEQRLQVLYGMIQRIDKNQDNSMFFQCKLKIIFLQRYHGMNSGASSPRMMLNLMRVLTNFLMQC